MDVLFNSEILAAKRKHEWDSLMARISTYTDSEEQVYCRKRNIQFTSVKHGFRKRFANCRKQTRPRKLAFEVQDLDIDESDTEVLSDDSSIYSANDELESDISDSESVNSVQYVLQCNEQRKLPDFNTKVENCQTYMLQNACFNQGVKENNANVSVNNISVNKKALLCEKNIVNEVSSLLEDQIPTHCSTSKSSFVNKTIENGIINPVENVQILIGDQSKISHSGNKQLKSILSTKMSENSSKINKKITFSSDPDSEIDIDEFESDDNVLINGCETEQLISKISNLSTPKSTKTLSTKNIALNNEVNINQLNIQKANNLEKAIYAIKTNEKSKIYSSAARKIRQLSVNTDNESSTSKNIVDQILEMKIAKSKTTINTALNEFLYNSSKETHINNKHVAKLTENESLVEINQCNEQNGELRTNTIRKTPTKHKETAKNKCNIIFSTELDSSDNESSILRTNLKESYVKNEDTIKNKIPCSYLSSSSSESDTESFVNHAIVDLKSNNFEKDKNKENTIRNEYSKNISKKENQTLYKQINSIKSNRQETPTIIDLMTVKTIHSVSKLENASPKDICTKLFKNTDSSNPLLKETSIDNSKEQHNKENKLPKENSTRIKHKELNKNREKRKIPKDIGMKLFSTEPHCKESECNLILKSKSNVLVENTNNFIKNNKTDEAETNKQCLISSTPNINAIRQKCLKEINVDDEIAELFSWDQSTILNEEHMNDIQKNIDENSSENDDEIFETIKSKKPGNFSRKQVKYNMTNIIDENTTVNDNYEDSTMSDTVVHLRYNNNGQKVITDSKHNGMLDISTSNELVNKVQPNTLIKSSRKKKSRENILESPTLSTKSNANNNSKIIKCRQRLFNSSSENDNDNCTIQLNSTVLTDESLVIKQDDIDKENSEDLNKANQTQTLPETADIISKQNSILQNHKKRKFEDSNCGSVKQIAKKPCTEQVTLNGTRENNIKQENKNSNNYKTIVDENTNISYSQSINDKENTKWNVSGKKNGKKRRSKCKKEIRFISYSTDTNDEDKMWSISSIKNRTPLSLEYFLDDDVF